MVSAAIGFILGTALGSFAKATADRVIDGDKITGRSYCRHCKHQLRWYDLFPVLSFIFLKGRCRYCCTKIPAGNFLTEVILGVLVALVFVTTIPFPADFSRLSDWQTVFLISDLVFRSFIITILAVVFLTDLKTGLIYDRVIYPAVILTAAYLVVSSAAKSVIYYQNLSSNPWGRYLLPPESNYLYDQLFRIWQPLGWSLISGAAAALFFISLIVITRGRGMGWGDVKYVFFLGLALGFPAIVESLILAFLLGSVFAIGLILAGRKSFGQTIPFGPFLSLGAMIALLWGQAILDWYTSRFLFIF